MTPAATDNPTAAYLMPLLAILAAGALSQAASSGWEVFYLLRLMAGLCALALYRRKLTALDWRWSWRGPALGGPRFLGVAHRRLFSAAAKRDARKTRGGACRAARILGLRRGRIGEAVAAHATTNALIAASVLGWSQWQLW